MADELLSAIETLKQRAIAQVNELKAQPQMAELLKIHVALNTLEGLCGIDLTALSTLFGLESAKPIEQIRPLVAVGEFFGKTPLDAAKLYLKKKGKPASLDEIIMNLGLGSCEVKSKADLRVSLGRSTFEIARLNEDNFGLLDWYPDEKAKRSAGGKRRSLSNDLMSPANFVPVGLPENEPESIPIANSAADVPVG